MTETTGSVNSKCTSVRYCNAGYLPPFSYLEPKLFMHEFQVLYTDIFTLFPFPVPGRVSSLSVTNTTLLITWDPPLTPSGDILVYEVHYQGKGGQEGGGVVNVTATYVELTGLRPESTYTISVRAYTAAAPGEESRLTVAAASTSTS